MMSRQTWGTYTTSCRRRIALTTATATSSGFRGEQRRQVHSVGHTRTHELRLDGHDMNAGPGQPTRNPDRKAVKPALAEP